MNFFQKFKNSLYSPRKILYNNISSLSGAIGYLLLITFSIGFVVSLSFVLEVRDYVDSLQLAFQKEMPEFKIENGELMIDVQENLRFSNENSILLIDVEDKHTDDILNDYLMAVLVKKESAIFKMGETKFVQDFHALTMDDDVIQNEDVLAYFEYVKIMTFFFIPLFLVVYWLGKMMSALFLCLFGKLMSSTKGIEIEFKKLLAIAIYALTLPIVIDAFTKVAHVMNDFVVFIYYVIGYFFVSIAITELARKDRIV
jgi:hypothetical protein